ncbi:hypothetical protein Tco_0128305 [Tanacetum coccineum]
MPGKNNDGFLDCLVQRHSDNYPPKDASHEEKVPDAHEEKSYLPLVAQILDLGWSSSLFCLHYVRHAYIESVENTYVLIIFAYESSLAGIVIDKRGALRKQQPEQKAHADLGCGRLTKVGCSREGTFERAIRQSFLAEFIYSLCGCSTKGCKAFQPVTEYMMKLQGLIFTRYIGALAYLWATSDEKIMWHSRNVQLTTHADALIDVGKPTLFVSTVANFYFDDVWTTKSRLDGILDSCRESRVELNCDCVITFYTATNLTDNYAEALRTRIDAKGSPMLMVTEMTKHIRVRASRGKTTPSEVG